MVDWPKANEDVIREVLREAEMRLQGQIDLALSADQRAVVLAGIYATTGTAVLGALLGALASKNVVLTNPEICGAIVSSAFFIIGAILCITAVIPSKIHMPGNDPESWYGDIDDNRKLKSCIGEMIVHYQSGISKNRKTIEANAKRFRWGAALGIAAPIVGVICWALYWSIGWGLTLLLLRWLLG